MRYARCIRYFFISFEVDLIYHLLGSSIRNTSPYKYYYLPPRLARNLSIFFLRTSDTHIIASPSSCPCIIFINRFFSVLMQWAEGGSLDDFIRARLGGPYHDTPSNPMEEHESRSARIRAFRAAQSRPEIKRARNREQRGRAVHFLSPTEVKSIFNDVVQGLGFLVSDYGLCDYAFSIDQLCSIQDPYCTWT